MTTASAATLALTGAARARAQDAVSATEQPAAKPDASSDVDPEQTRIIVIGNRAIIASLQDVPIEREYDTDEISSYAVSTVEELLAEIRRENGDADAAVLVNGQPVRNMDDIADLPVEAVRRIEALPRGAAQRVGGAAGQRAFNIVLRPSVKSLTATASREEASEGGWHNSRGEALATYIKGPDRLNLTLRGADSGTLFENERDQFIPRAESTPFSAIGNIIPASGFQIDAALSALAGRTVTVAALPAGNTRPTLATLVAGANAANPSNLSAFRSLRGANSNYDLALAGNKQINDWLSLSANARLNWTRGRNFSGLPTARFLIPSTNAFTPFSTPVLLALNDPTRPLTSRNKSTGVSLGTTLNASFGDWLATFSGRYDQRDRTFESQFTGPFAPGASTVGNAVNPFDGGLAATIPVAMRLSDSNSTTYQLSTDVEGPLLDLWAGALRVRAGASAQWIDFDAEDSAGARRFSRHEYLAKAGVTIPLTSRDPAFLPAFGDSEIAADISVVDLGSFGTLNRHSLAFNWQPREWLRIVADENSDELAFPPELLSSPAVITPNVPYFDPLTAQTVDVTTINGGAGNLQNQKFRTRSLSLTATPLKPYNLQLNANYSVIDTDNQLGALPPPSSAVVAAFPDRFVRDATGTLIQVDQRSINFARQHNRQLRLGVSYNVPIQKSVTIAPKRGEPLSARRRIPALSLQLNASHTFILESTTVIRSGLPAVDLLEGGAIGIGGGQQRHATDVSLALTQGRSGVRLNARRRGESFLVIGSLAAPDLLTFSPLSTVDLKVFADFGEFFRGVRAAKDTRITLSFQNLANERQSVTNRARITPQAYQPVYRDAIGRTVSLELRKVF
jgi:hypothetical protein